VKSNNRDQEKQSSLVPKENVLLCQFSTESSDKVEPLPLLIFREYLKLYDCTPKMKLGMSVPKPPSSGGNSRKGSQAESKGHLKRMPRLSPYQLNRLCGG
jgi:hypothetical protein